MEPPAIGATASLGQNAVADDEYIVLFRRSPNLSPATIDLILQRAGAEVIHRYTTVVQGAHVRLSASAAEALARNPLVEHVERDAIVLPANGVTVPANSWGRGRVDQRSGAADGWYTYDHSGAGSTIYIIDSGIAPNAEEFGSRLQPGHYVYWAWGSTNDCFGHGTSVASLAAGSAFGIAPGANLVPVRIAGCDGSSTHSRMIAALDWVAANKVHPAVANISYGGSLNSTVGNAVDRLVYDHGVAVVVSAGNDNADACWQSPAATVSAITVGNAAQDASGNLFRWTTSNWGMCLDLFAPGQGVRAMTISGNPGTFGGTSAAAPHVAGFIASLRAVGLSRADAEFYAVRHATLGAVVDPRATSYFLYVRHDFGALIQSPNYTIPPNTSRTYTARTFFGAGGYTFEWYRDNVLVCTTVSCTMDFPGTPDGYGVEVRLVGRDASGAVFSDVKVDWVEPWCEPGWENPDC